MNHRGVKDLTTLRLGKCLIVATFPASGIGLLLTDVGQRWLRAKAATRMDKMPSIAEIGVHIESG